MAKAYILDLVGVVCDFDMDKVKSLFNEQGKSDLFDLRKSPDPAVRLAAESEFEQILERGIVAAHIPATPVEGVEEVIKAVRYDPDGNIVIYSNGTTTETAYTLLEIAGIKDRRLSQITHEGLIILDGKVCGNKAQPESYKNMLEQLAQISQGIRCDHSGQAKLRPQLFVDDQKVNAEAAYTGLIGSGCSAMWLDRKITAENARVDYVMPNLSQIAGYILHNGESLREGVSYL